MAPQRRRFGRFALAGALAVTVVGGCIPERGTPPALCSRTGEPNDTLATRQTAPFGSTLTVTLCPGDVDIVQYDAPAPPPSAGQFLNVRLTCTAPYELRARNGNGSEPQDFTLEPCANPVQEASVALGANPQLLASITELRPVAPVAPTGTIVTFTYSITAAPLYPLGI